LACKPLEVGNHGANKLLAPWVLRSECSCKEIEEIASFVGSFLLICRRRCQRVSFQFVLPKAQGLLDRFHVRHQPSKFGSLLGSHSAMLIQVDRFLGHDRSARRVRYSALSCKRRMSSFAVPLLIQFENHADDNPSRSSIAKADSLGKSLVAERLTPRPAPSPRKQLGDGV
jgi:hypothetical protein